MRGSPPVGDWCTLSITRPPATTRPSEIRISVICREEQLDDAVRALHAAFELGGDELAVVHAGTGR